jgi:hypothetical protein
MLRDPDLFVPQALFAAMAVAVVALAAVLRAAL